MPRPLGQAIICFSVSVALLSWNSAPQSAQPGTASPREITAKTEPSLKQALRGPLAPGTVVKIAPGRYTGYHALSKQAGTESLPIVITALDPGKPPVFADSATVGLQVINCAYVTLKNLRFENNRDIGLHITWERPADPSYDTLSPSHHITVEDVSILDTGTTDWGNHDGLKIAGTDHFTVRRVHIRGWGSGSGSALDIVACQFGIIEDSSFAFPGRPVTGNAFGITMKCGSRDMVVRRNSFSDAGCEVIQIGQDSGLYGFRDPIGSVLANGTVLNYEARDIEVCGNLIVGSNYPIMWMKSTETRVHHNTIVMPEQAAKAAGAPSVIERSILKITSWKNDGLLRANNARFENNLVVYSYGGLQKWGQPFVRCRNDGDPTLVTFKFANNAWYQLDVSSQGRYLPDTVGNLGLPSAEKDPVYQVDPQLAGLNYDTGGVVLEQVRVRSSDPRLRDVGADSYARSPKSEAAESPAPAVRRQPR